jgi:hypothetical protein
LQQKSKYTLPFTAVARGRPAAIILLVCCMAGCATDAVTLNSERIARKFGSYGVEIIENTNNIRVSNLYSKESDERICRTFAVVLLNRQIDAAFAAEHALISGGASIGAVFTDHGWDIEKLHQYIGDVRIDSHATRVARLMRLEPSISAAIHIYVLTVRKDGETFDYATIAEVHHPDYLTSVGLRSIYGAEYSGRSSRNAVGPLIQSVVAKFGEPVR